MSQDNQKPLPPPDGNSNPAGEPSPLPLFTNLNPDTFVSPNSGLPTTNSLLKRMPVSGQPQPSLGLGDFEFPLFEEKSPAAFSPAIEPAAPVPQPPLPIPTTVQPNGNPGQATATLIQNNVKSIESKLPEPLAQLAEEVTKPLTQTVANKLNDPALVDEVTQPIVQQVTSRLPQAPTNVPKPIAEAVTNFVQPSAQKLAEDMVQPTFQAVTAQLPPQFAQTIKEIEQPIVRQVASQLATPVANAVMAQVPQPVWDAVDKVPEEGLRAGQNTAPTLLNLAKNVATGNYSQPDQTEPPKPEDYNVSKDAAQVKLALSLGAVIMELRGRVWQDFYLLDPTKPNQQKNRDLIDGFSDNFWRASTWRGLYSRLLDLHTRLLGDDSVNLVSYGISLERPLYLSDQRKIIYTDAGINTQALKFGIAEKLRRALNFLICLYQEMDDFEDILKEVFEGQDPALKLPDGEEDNVRNRYRYLVQNLTEQVGILLNAWDSYVREQLFARSSSMLMARYGYNAGRAMSELSWLLAAKTAQLRAKSKAAELVTKSQQSSNGLDFLLDTTPNPKMAQQIFDNKNELSQQIFEVWLDSFKPGNISYLQRQLSAISTVLDADYKLKLSDKTDDNTAAQDDVEDEEISDLKSPRTAINSVVQSIGYWQLTVLELSEAGRLQKSDDLNQPDLNNPKPPVWSPTLKLGKGWTADNLRTLQSALSEQQSNWFDLVAGRQNLLSFRITNVASDVLQDYRKQIVEQFSKDIVQAMQQQIRELAEVASNVGKEVANSAKTAIDSLIDRRWIYAAIAVVALGIILLLGAVILGSASGLGGSGLGIGGAGLSLAGLLQAGGLGWMYKRSQNAQQAINQASLDKSAQVQQAAQTVNTNMGDAKNADSTLITNFKQVPAYVEEVLKRGFDQLKIELRLISATLALTGPLAEFVTHNCDVKNDWDFLNKIVWNDQVKRTQLDRIIVAAFGPIGQLIVATADTLQGQIEAVPTGNPATTTVSATSTTVSVTATKA